MMTNDEKVLISGREIELIKEQAVVESRVNQLEDDMPKVLAGIRRLDDRFSEIPLSMLKCRDDLEKDIKGFVHTNFITEKEFSKEINKLSLRISKAGWLVSGFVTACTTIMYLITYTTVFQ